MTTTPLPPPTTHVQLSALPTGKIHLPDRWLFEDGDADQTRARQFCPDFSFVVSHPSGGRVLFDLGINKDLENCPEVIKADFPLIEPVVTEDAYSLLSAGPIPPSSVTAIVLSHLHFDHVGDGGVQFPSASLIVGSGSKAVAAPGWPREQKSPFCSAALEHPGFQELDFDNEDEWTALGPFERAFDFFGDGSFWLVDAPGHMPGHLGALAATGEDEWVFMGGDCCHHRSLLEGRRPVSVTVGPNGTSSFHAAPQVAMQTMARVRALEAEGNVLVALAHDQSLEGKMPLYPEVLNGWRGSEWVKAARGVSGAGGLEFAAKI